MSFIDKVVLITGASSGVGADTAKHMSKLSANLVLVGRNSTNLKETADICEKNSGLKPLQVIADVTNDDDIERIIEATKKHFGKLDVLVNNAGIAGADNILNMDMKQYDRIMNTNVRSMFNLTRLAVPMLIESKGNIINISSVVAVKPSPNILTYSVSKAAVNSFTKTIALQLAQKKVRVNAIVLGYALTNIQERSGADPNMHDRMLKAVPLKQPVELADVSNLIAYLASDDAKSITGHYVAIDGGYTSV